MGIKKRKISSEMKQSYLEYAMSVIVARALPDVRDGLKPVQRRILNTMYEDGLRHNAKFRKSATVVGGTLGKYHPHGDSAVYEALARMAQDFSLRYPLVQGQGNWGSIDGDPPAAQRYTECRLSKFGEELLKDIEKETVDYSPNYDATREEPVVLPSPIPNLLLNGAMGIAVGLSTNIPPHNLTETCDALFHLLENPEATVADLFKFIKGPDFPTGGEVYDAKGMMKAYEDGRGPILTRGKAEIVEKKKGLHQIVIKEIPYGLQKSNLLRNIANLARERAEGIRTIRDESDKEGLRVVIELKKDIQPTKILNQLYKYTELEKVFYLNMVGLEKGIQPKTFSLKQALENFLDHRREVVKRRTEYDLRKTEERIHILYGLKKALANIDEVIDIIKKSKDRKTAAKNLISRFKFSEKQAEVILNTKLESLVALEKDRILKELEEKKQKAKELREILEKSGGIEAVIKEELEDIKKRFGDKRRTKVVPQKVKDFSEDDLIPEEENILIITEGGYIKRVPTSSFRTQKRGGKGVSGLSLKEEDKVAHFLYISSHDEVLFFTNQGKVFKIKAFEIPEISRSGFGKGIVNFIELAPQEKVTALINFSKKNDNNFLIMGTKNGMVKKTDISKFRVVRKNGLRAMGLKENDELCFVNESSGKDEVLLASERGNVIRFPEKDIREMGRGAKGVKGMKLKTTKKKEDKIVGMDIVSPLDKQQDSYLLTLSEKGYSKRTKISKFKLQKRGGRGIIGMKLVGRRTGSLSTAFLVKEEKELMMISEKGQTIRTKIKDIPVLGRSTQGVRVIKIKDKKDKIVSAVAV